MTLTETMQKQFRQPTGYLGNISGWLMTTNNRQRLEWTVDQLNIQPYQHILEIGYGSGQALQEVGRRLKIGFLAGTDHSLLMYKQAFRRNKALILDQLLELHIGGISELDYPPYYFHTVYGSNVHVFWKDPVNEFIRLTRLLKIGGKLVMVFQPRGARNNHDVEVAAKKMRSDYQEAGLSNIQIEFRDLHPATCIAAIGYKI